MTGSRDTFHGASGNPGDPEGLLGGRVLGGSGPPEAEYGGVNDWYIDEDLMVLYGPKKVAGWGDGAVRLFVGVNVEAISGAKDLAVGDAGIQRLDPDDDYDVNLPAASADIVGCGFYIQNTDSGSNTLTVKDDGDTVVAAKAGYTVLVYCATASGWALLTSSVSAHAAEHESGGDDEIKLDDLGAPDDNTDLDATASAHGLLPKLPDTPRKVLTGQGGWLFQHSVNFELGITSNKNLTATDNSTQMLLFSGSHYPTVPAASSDIVGLHFLIFNSHGSVSFPVYEEGEESAGDELVVVPPKSSALIICRSSINWEVAAVSFASLYETVIWSCRTTDATPEVMEAASGGGWEVPDGGAAGFRIDLIGHGLNTTPDPDERATLHWVFEGTAERDDSLGILRFVDTTAKEVRAQDRAGWDAEVALDAGTAELDITVTGEADWTIDWRGAALMNVESLNLR